MSVVDQAYAVLCKLPRLARMQRELALLRPMNRFVPPGHFYSPIVSPDEVRRDRERLFAPPPRTLPGLDLREPAQLELLEALRPLYADIPFGPSPAPGLRYGYDNTAYSYSDAIFLHLLMRHLRPQRVVEVGSGHSSCAMLDTDERFLGGSVAFTFIEPYPQLLNALITEADKARVRIVGQRVQDVDAAVFEALGAGDILFIDSTHVSKLGSDVNRLFFEVLPSLRPGVLVHVHDIFYPFEYPRAWIDEGRCWNEAYLLRAFLQFNQGFEVVLMNTFMQHFQRGWFEQHMPLCLRNPGGSIWLRRV